MRVATESWLIGFPDSVEGPGFITWTQRPGASSALPPIWGGLGGRFVIER
jgi:hypothetical protein